VRIGDERSDERCDERSDERCDEIGVRFSPVVTLPSDLPWWIMTLLWQYQAKTLVDP